MSLWIVANGESSDELEGTFAYTNWQEANYGRAAYILAGGSTDNLLAYLKGNRNRVWHKHALYKNGGSSAGRAFLSLYDGDPRTTGVERLRFSFVYNAGGTLVKCESINGATVVALIANTNTGYPFYSATGNITTNTNPLGDFGLDVNYAAGGWVRIYRGNILVGEFLGDPRVGGSTTLSYGKKQSPNSGASWGEAAFSQIIYGDEDITGMKIVSHYPNAAGSTNTFSSGSFANIDEAGTPGTDFNESLVANQKELFAMSDVPAAVATPVVRALILRSTVQGAAAGSGGPTKVRQLQKSGATETQGAQKTPSAVAFDLVSDQYDVNPATGVAYTKAEINALEIGHLSEA